MKRIVAIVAVLLLALLVLPPLWFSIFPQPAPELPPPGRRVEVSPGVSVNLIEEGSGAPIVLVHGQPGTAYDWSALMPELSRRGFHAMAYDRVGYGRSDARQSSDYTVHANAEELLALLDAEGVDNAVIVGWSYGGAISIVAARKDPSRMSRLVLIGSVGPGIENRSGPPQFVADLMMGGGFRWLARVPPLGRRVQAALAADAFDPDPIRPGFLTQLAANFAQPYTRTTFTSEGRDLDGTTDISPKAVKVPTLIIHGDGDRLVPLPIAEELHRLAENSELLVIPHASHMLPVTHAAVVADRIAAFATPRG
jgi:pimeloyl-ACP methyl ester carboxylesterase